MKSCGLYFACMEIGDWDSAAKPTKPGHWLCCVPCIYINGEGSSWLGAMLIGPQPQTVGNDRYDMRACLCSLKTKTKTKKKGLGKMS